MKIKDLQKIDLPREKLAKYGVNKLRDYELLAILLGSGIEGLNVLQLSKKILDAIKKIGIKKITLSDLLKIKGLGNCGIRDCPAGCGEQVFSLVCRR